MGEVPAGGAPPRPLPDGAGPVHPQHHRRGHRGAGPALCGHGLAAGGGEDPGGSDPLLRRGPGRPGAPHGRGHAAGHLEEGNSEQLGELPHTTGAVGAAFLVHLPPGLGQSLQPGHHQLERRPAAHLPCFGHGLAGLAYLGGVPVLPAAVPGRRALPRLSHRLAG